MWVVRVKNRWRTWAEGSGLDALRRVVRLRCIETSLASLEAFAVGGRQCLTMPTRLRPARASSLSRPIDVAGACRLAPAETSSASDAFDDQARAATRICA